MNVIARNDRYPAVASITALALLLGLVLLVCGAPIYTEDFWWHLKAGEMYATEGLWPAGDWMLHTARPEAPIQHEWLFGVALFELQSLIGFQGLRIVHVLLAAAILWMVFDVLRRHSAWLYRGTHRASQSRHR